MRRPGFLSLGKLTALCTTAAVGIVLFVGGQEMFSPGALNAQSRTDVPLGGVRSHAEIGGNCSACHVPPWSEETMMSRCLNCHTDVRDQLNSGRPLHGMLARGTDCRECHTEHHGAHARITSLEKFNHDCTAFPLTGLHREVSCAACHAGYVFKGTPQDCYSCHAEPDVHRGKFGTDCAHCHSTLGWEDVTFAHSFPMHHGNGKRRSDCAVCHKAENDYREYTCYGCHKHNPTKTAEKHLKRGIADVRDCAHCHPTGRKQRRAAAEDSFTSPLRACCAAEDDLFSALARGGQQWSAESPPIVMGGLELTSSWEVPGFSVVRGLSRCQNTPALRTGGGSLPTGEFP